MSHEKARQEIVLLEEAVVSLDAKVERAGRGLNEAETDLKNAMVAKIAEMKMDLPGPVLSNPLGHLNRSGGTIEQVTAPMGRDYRSMFGIAKGTGLDKGGFKNFNEFLTVLSSGRYDERLNNFRAVASETIPSEGGFSCPEEFAAWLLDASLETEIVRSRATVWPMKSNTIKVPGWDAATHSSSLYGGLIGVWLAELGAATEVFAKMRQIQLIAKKLACYTSASNELVADGVDFDRQIQVAMIKTIGWYLDYAFLQGTGAGQPAGIIGNPAMVTVSKETGQKASTVVFENCVKMYARLAPQCMEKAVWLASQTTVPQLLTMSLAVGTGGSMVQPAVLQEGGKFSLLGKPVLFTEKVPALGSLGDLILVDLSQYVIGMRKEVSLDKSIHVGWSQDISSYRAIIRADGMGSWDKAISPKAGDSLSWCVALQART